MTLADQIEQEAEKLNEIAKRCQEILDKWEADTNRFLKEVKP